MRQSVDAAYIEFVEECTRAIMGHLYQFTTASGSNDYFTDLDIDVTWNGHTWKSDSLRFDGLRRKTNVGLEVDEQSFRIIANSDDTIFGSSFLGAIEEGILDGGYVTRYRAVWPVVTGNLAYDIQNPSPAGWPKVFVMFKGYIGEITRAGKTIVDVKARSPLAKLAINMPRNYYQPSCLWTLYDTGCGLNKADFAVTGTVGSSPTITTIPVSGGIATPTGADGVANFAKGRLEFTSGVNNGLQIFIDTNDANNIYPAYPLNNVPSAGDTFTMYPGCIKTFKTCDLKFNDTANWRGFDKVPPISTSI